MGKRLRLSRQGIFILKASTFQGFYRLGLFQDFRWNYMVFKYKIHGLPHFIVIGKRVI